MPQRAAAKTLLDMAVISDLDITAQIQALLAKGAS